MKLFERIPLRCRFILKGDKNILYRVYNPDTPQESKTVLTKNKGIVWLDLPQNSVVEKVEWLETMFPERTRIQLTNYDYTERN